MRLIDADKLLLHLADYQLQESPDWGANGCGNKDAYEAITHCIEAVEEAPTCMNCEKMHDDLISRQAALKGFAKYSDAWCYINALPTAEPRKGKWILQSDTYHEYWECDQCGMGVGLDDVRNYCPNCGADMTEEESDVNTD